jgi:hypothetical protein
MTAYAGFTAAEFCDIPNSDVLQALLRSDAVSGFTQVSHDQLRAWRIQLDLLRPFAEWARRTSPTLAKCGIVLEYRVPRREKRIDVVVLLFSTVVVIEFKCGSRQIAGAAVDQLSDYLLDLSYYHAESLGRRLVPVLCPTELAEPSAIKVGEDTPLDDIRCVGGSQLFEALRDIAVADAAGGTEPIGHVAWAESAYRPVPGVIEATVELFAKHEVSDIASALAEGATIRATLQAVASIIAQTRRERRKTLCLLTGVPGAGKTLTGLQVVHSQDVAESEWRTVFLSGNGPLLKVLKAALAHDYRTRQNCTQVRAKNYANSLLHSVDSYLAESLKTSRPPSEQVVVFDEAQRAWDAKKMEKMAGRQRRMSGEEPIGHGSPGPGSEPKQILNVLDRHSGGAVVIALCGNGQEIHDGEAGVSEWVTARDEAYPDWQLYCSPVAAGLAAIPNGHNNTVVDARLHLDVPLRAHRATRHTNWVDDVLAGDADAARRNINQEQFPILLTRDLDDTRRWLKANTLGSRRCGLLASSGANRLRPYGIEVSADLRKGVDYAIWFTSPRGDIRSSHALEVAATEFECQGLELDRTGVCWCWDMLLMPRSATPRVFQGSKWRATRPGRETEYVTNKYRVLLTRAREGTVIWVPRGDADDPTRSPCEADRVASFLLSCGVIPLCPKSLRASV